MKYQVEYPAASSGFVLKLRCPHCGHNGTFEVVGVNDLRLQDTGNILGQRKCPNTSCNGHVFFVHEQVSNNNFTYPPEGVELNRNNVPGGILSAFEEAISCYSNQCYVAAAIMIRKTLEEIAVEKKADGKNLFQKLSDLSTKIFVPKELTEAMHELRLLGNDAAHIEAEAYNQVGKEEVEISIEFTKEIIKAVYQYESLLGKLRSLKKPVA
ncbi:MAG: DUF4145 domain-containing protein [Janthinobacterium lividum]